MMSKEGGVKECLYISEQQGGGVEECLYFRTARRWSRGVYIFQNSMEGGAKECLYFRAARREE